MLRLLLLATLGLLISGSANGQSEAPIDSLVTDLESRAADDTLRFLTLRRLWQATRQDQETNKAYARQIIQEATAMSHKPSMAEGHKLLGVSLVVNGNRDSVFYHNSIAAALYRETGNNLQLGVIQFNTAISHQETGNYDKARELLKQADVAFATDTILRYQSAVNKLLATIEREQGNAKASVKHARKAYDLALQAKDSASMIDAQQEIAFALLDLGKQEEALKYFLENRKFYRQHNDPFYETVAILNAAGVYQATERHGLAEALGKEALAIVNKHNFSDLEVDVQNSLGNIYWEVKDYAQAEGHFLRAAAILEGANGGRMESEILSYLSAVQSHLGKLNLARKTGERALKMTTDQGQLEFTHKVYGYMAINEKKAGNFEAAYDHMVMRQGFQDSLYQIELGEKVAELSLAFEKEKQDRLISEQKSQLAILEGQSEIDRLQKRSLGIGIAALALLFGIIVYLFQQRGQRQQLEKEALAEKVKGQQRELSSHALQMAQKGQLLDQLGEELRQIKGERPDDRKKLDGMLRELSSEERIDKDWANFRTYFQGVHGGFETRLKAAAEPSLSPRELRLAALIKMQLNNQEVGAILGVSQDSLYKAKYRLRKKLAGAGEGELDGFIREL